MEIEYIHPDELRNHPDNLIIYGDVADQDLVASVAKYGVFHDQPIGYVMDGDYRVIVSGHRRRQAAKMAGLDMVPIIRLKDIEGKDELIKERIVLSNTQRVKTNEQKSREAKFLADLYSASLNSLSAPKVPEGVGEKRPEKKVADYAKDMVSRKLGVSPRTAQRMISSGKALEEVEKSGDEEAAKELKEALDQSMAAAERTALKIKRSKIKNGAVFTRSSFDEKKHFEKPFGELRRGIDARLKHIPGSEALHKEAKEHLTRFLDTIERWRLV